MYDIAGFRGINLGDIYIITLTYEVPEPYIVKEHDSIIVKERKLPRTTELELVVCGITEDLLTFSGYSYTNKTFSVNQSTYIDLKNQGLLRRHEKQPPIPTYSR